MATFVNVDVVPQTGRPDPVTTALTEAIELRDRHRDANEMLAAAQTALEQAQQADVDATAEKIRAGTQPGAIPASVQKAKQAVELALRNALAIGVASDAAQTDLATAMIASADSWLEELDGETARARQRAHDALAALEAALHEITATASASLWVRSALDDGRWDRPQRQAIDARIARSSARASANREAFTAEQIIAWAHELLEPPTSTPVSIVVPDTITAA
jgi:hypothetical protein